MDKDFLGAGWKFPVRIDEDGSFSLSKHEEDIKEAIIIILKTIQGERFNHPDFGSGVYDYLFSPVNRSTISLIKEEIERSLKKYEHRIDIEEVNIQIEEAGKLLINIEYTIRSTNKKENLVYPFYIRS
ncbi:GPW/gp25 family protein [Persephonella sp.]|uniref:GPW/gp25 family protein n=2 Tax=Persephonella sp. TaxID=2060922 RepID=UPI0025DA012D|nr:GPW/gp25 family protein [Persephonella sp.]